MVSAIYSTSSAGTAALKVAVTATGKLDLKALGAIITDKSGNYTDAERWSAAKLVEDGMHQGKVNVGAGYKAEDIRQYFADLSSSDVYAKAKTAYAKVDKLNADLFYGPELSGAVAFTIRAALYDTVTDPFERFVLDADKQKQENLVYAAQADTMDQLILSGAWNGVSLGTNVQTAEIADMGQKAQNGYISDDPRASKYLKRGEELLSLYKAGALSTQTLNERILVQNKANGGPAPALLSKQSGAVEALKQSIEFSKSVDRFSGSNAGKLETKEIIGLSLSAKAVRI